MTVLTIVQNFCARNNLPQPTTVIGSTDTQVAQIVAILEEEGNDLAARGPWESIIFEASLTTTAAEDQGAMSTIASNGFRYIKNQTIWDRTLKLPIIGPLSSQEWQAMKALVSASPRYRFRIRGGKLLVNPAPTAGNNWRFEYVSQNWILATDNTTYKKYFTADTDNVLLPDTLLLMGLRWRWLREKGMEYAELFRTYEMQVKDALSRDGGQSVLNMNVDQSSYPGVFIPAGNWIAP